MERTKIVIVLSVGVIFAVFTESNGIGNGCEWSGCQEFAGSPCRTGVTGGSGRRNHFRSKSCGFMGRKDFCCDDDCGYLECDIVSIGVKFTNEVPRVQCGVPSPYLPWKEFVCGTNGVVPYGISANRNNDRNFGFRDNGGSSGFRNNNTDAAERNGGFRSSAGGSFRNNANESGDGNTVSKNEGFRSNSSGGGGFRTK